MYGAGDVRVENVPDPTIQAPTDAIVRVTAPASAAATCGLPVDARQGAGPPMGHEFIGIVEEVGSDVADSQRGDFVIAPFVWSDNTCDFCREGLHTSCRHGGGWGAPGLDAGQGEAVRVPLAQGTLVKLPVAEDSALLPSLLTLSDVFCTGHHGAVTAGSGPATRSPSSATAPSDCAAVLAAKRLGAEQIILMGRHQDRTDLGREFGATDVVAERGEEGIAKRARADRRRRHARGPRVRRHRSRLRARARAWSATGGAISRVGVPQYTEAPAGFDTCSPQHHPHRRRRARPRLHRRTDARHARRHASSRAGSSTAPSGLDETPDGYKAMAERESLKVLIRP